MSTKADMAIAFHDKGYNCAQAVACSFCQEFGVAEEEMFHRTGKQRWRSGKRQTDKR